MRGLGLRGLRLPLGHALAHAGQASCGVQCVRLCCLRWECMLSPQPVLEGLPLAWTLPVTHTLSLHRSLACKHSQLLSLILTLHVASVDHALTWHTAWAL